MRQDNRHINRDELFSAKNNLNMEIKIGFEIGNEKLYTGE